MLYHRDFKENTGENREAAGGYGSGNSKRKGLTFITWSEYILRIASPHSKGSARHWFRYLRKDIDKCGDLFTKQDVEALYENEALTPFQRVSLRSAFEEDSPTRRYIMSLNEKITE